MSSFSKSTQMTSFCLLLIHLHFLLLLLISICQFPLTCHGCHEQERRALLDFKSSFGDPANRLSSWQDSNQHRNCCNWKGIGCSYDFSRVISINLRNTVGEFYYDNFYKENTSLTGKLSPSVFNILTHLEYIDLAYNDFQYSEIPFQLSNLKKLSYLDLSHSNIGSSISTQFGNLSSLHHLDLSGNYNLQLSFMKWVRGLINLQVLNFSGIDLSAATSSEENFAEHISYLSNLRDLDISSCSISSPNFPIRNFHNLSRLSSLIMNTNFRLVGSKIPPQLANLTSLSYLNLSNCQLHGSLPYLPQLKKLDVSSNYGFDLDLTKMLEHQWAKLQTLSISYVTVNGSIPASISNAPSLVSLSATYCSIQGSLPSSIYNLSQLEFLDLSYNHIGGYIHSSISNLKILNILKLTYNNFQGSIPIQICELVSLQVLLLDSNNITGTLPSCISELKNLADFTVNNNSIEGTVSLISYINELNLVSLDLSSNRLTVVLDQHFHLYTKFKLEYLALPSCNLKGLFPTFICELSHLHHLNLSHNHMTGVIPSCISKLKNLLVFDISNNKLHGPLPLPPQAGFEDRTFFDVSNNKIRGEISIESGKRLYNFSNINLAGNQLSGSIPFSNDLSGYRFDSIDFSNNKFSGSIPFNSICIHDPILIDLSNNKLSGTIPTSIGHCTGLNYLNLGTNNLSGNIPNELGNVYGLTYLQLQNNNLDGNPRIFTSKLQELKVLNLANNQFGGSIPFGFGSLYDLRIVSLRSNKFNGSIPEGILNHLENLQVLDFSHNKLTGLIPRNIGNLKKLKTRPTVISRTDDIFFLGSYAVDLQMVIKGIMTQLVKLYDYSSGIDLSCNILEGNIPYEIGSLQGLSMLNLSHNRFSGVIPNSVGNMSGLESLDLSFNKLSGHIPPSLTSLGFLGKLNLSYNNLSGRIPREAHFDTLSEDGSAYANNNLLCGFYTNNTCEGDQRSNATESNPPKGSYEDDKVDTEEKLLYAIAALGFGVGFWGLFLILLLNKEKWWFGYWRLVDGVAFRLANYLL